ncbi:MAG: protein kinase [Thermoleophilia bacterium]
MKPANLLLDAAGRVRVADFGIARVLGDPGATMTAAGTVAGTPGYVSPEQAQGRPVTPAADQYSLAAVAFELLAGERPYAPRTGLAELAAHVHDPARRSPSPPWTATGMRPRPHRPPRRPSGPSCARSPRR